MSSNKKVFITISLGLHLCVACLLFYLTTSYPTFYSIMVVSLLELPVVEMSGSPNVRVPEAVEPSVKTLVVPSATMATPYVPASQLDVKPQIVKDIDPDLLENFRGVLAQWLNLTLLINEYGDVDQVIIESLHMTPDLPEGLLADLKQRFLEARFSPGRLNNQSVRSSLRIRVHLD
jgi:hypothetical protein